MTIRTIQNSIVAVLVTALLPSCIISETIYSSGKRYGHLMDSETTVAEVRKELGQPVWRKEYIPSQQIRNIPIYKEYSKTRPPYFLGDEVDTARLCEVYNHQGPFYDQKRSTGYGMASGMTLGVADIINIPSAVKGRKKMESEVFGITFWYDEHGKFVALTKADIRDPSSSWEW